MIRVKTFICAIAGLLILSATSLQAQITKKEAADAYNQGIALLSTNPGAAIDSFERSVKLATVVGDEANDIKEQAGKVLPGLYYKKVVKFTNDKKFDEAIAACKQTITASEKYGNDNVKEETKKIMVQVYTNIGNNLTKANDQPNAIKSYDSALSINPNYTKAIFYKAVVYTKLADAPKFSETIDLAIGKAKTDNDTTFSKQMEKVARDFFKNSGIKSNKAKKPAEAIGFLNTSQKYGNDEDVYYYLANIFNTQKKYADAAVNAQKGLDMVTGAAVAKAKFYYELAVAQLGKGEKDNACGNFKNASFGPFAPAAKAQMTNMKCPGAEPAPKAVPAK